MAAMITEVIGAFTDTVAVFMVPPLSYVVGVMIVGAAVGMIANLFMRN